MTFSHAIQVPVRRRVLWGLTGGLAVLTIAFVLDLPLGYQICWQALTGAVVLSLAGFFFFTHLPKVFRFGDGSIEKEFLASTAPLLAVGLLTAYMLSIGPAVAIAKSGWIRGSSLERVYAPVIWLGDHTILKKPIVAYLKLWGMP